MNVLLGDGRGRKLIANLKRLGWGRMCVQVVPAPFDDERWGFDNGAFTTWRHGTDWDGDVYLRRLERAARIGTPCLAVCPDIVAAGRRSLDFSLMWMSRLPREWPWYLAVQDGMTSQSIIEVLDQFDGIFLGGSDAFKLQARDWCDLAHRHGKLFHFARAGTVNKALFAQRIGSDSIDSAFPLWTQARFDTFQRAVNGERPQGWFFREDEYSL